MESVATLGVSFLAGRESLAAATFATSSGVMLRRWTPHPVTRSPTRIDSVIHVR